MLGRTVARREGEAESSLVNRTFEQTRSSTGRGTLEQNFDMDASGDLSQEELASMAVSVVRDYFTARNDQRFADATDEQILQIVADPDIEFVDGALARIVKRIMGFGLDLNRIRQDTLSDVIRTRQPGSRQRGGALGFGFAEEDSPQPKGKVVGKVRMTEPSAAFQRNVQNKFQN